MDHAICYGPRSIFKKAVFPALSRKVETLDERFIDAVEKDDKKEFLSIIKDPEFGTASADKIFRNDALHIGMAVLNGETEGIIDFQNTGMPHLHYAALCGAPRLTNYLLQSGADTHAISKCNWLGKGQHTALDMAVSKILDYQKGTLFDILLTLCHSRREELEVIRLLVQGSQCPEYVRRTFIKYEGKWQLAPLAALFLAAPEFFLSSYKNVTDIHESEEMTLLLDIIDMVGDKLVAYIRLQETSDQIIEQSQMDIAFLLHQVSHKKLGVSSPDYFFRFFKPLTFQPHKQLSDHKPLVPKITWEDHCSDKEKPGPWMFSLLPNIVKEEDIDKADIYRLLPTLEPDEEGRLNGSIEKKLSSMSGFKGVFEGMMRKISNEGEKHVPQWFPSLFTGKFEQNVQPFPAYVPSANHMFDFKIAPTQTQTWKNKVMKLVEPKFNFLVMLSDFPKVVKRLLK